MNDNNNPFDWMHDKLSDDEPTFITNFDIKDLAIYKTLLRLHPEWKLIIKEEAYDNVGRRITTCMSLHRSDESVGVPHHEVIFDEIMMLKHI